MDELRLPEDLRRALDVTPAPELDAGGYGEFVLFTLAELRVEPLPVRPSNAPFAEEDPHYMDYGHYPVPAVNLVRGLKEGRSHFEWWFLWLPNERRYGSYDLDHRDLTVFGPEVTWTDIVGAPEDHAMAAEVAGTDEIPMEFFRPWPRYAFVAEPGPDDEFEDEEGEDDDE